MTPKKQKHIKCPLNYVGNKCKLLDQILPKFPTSIDTFFDVFAGGANVGINVPSKNLILNDNNTYLIELYKDFYQTPYNDILNHVQGRVNQYQLTRIDNVGENGFKDLRNLYNQQKNPLDLFVLVAFSFNHQIRFNNAHDYNSSFAWGKHLFNSKMKDNLCLFVHALQS